MQKIAVKLSLLSAVCLSLNACAFSSDSQDLAYNAPALGTGTYEPLEISNVSNTGTFVGQKVVTFRNELGQLQGSIRKHNDELQQIRSGVTGNAQQYHRAVAAIETKLQIGTTPGNPNVLSALKSAQDNVQVMSSTANSLNQLSARVRSDVTMSSNLLDSIRSSYVISGAVDDDHRQLRILENETNQTYILLESLQNEVSNDAVLQQQYVETARTNLISLDAPIRQGNYGGEISRSSSSYQPRPVMTGPRAPVQPVQTAPLPMFTPQAAPAAMGMPSAPTGKPFFVAKFNKENVDYQAGLKRAVEAALSRKPDINFDVVAVNASRGSYTDAQKNAGKIFQEIINMGVNPDNVSLSSRVDNVDAPEVQIFVR